MTSKSIATMTRALLAMGLVVGVILGGLACGEEPTPTPVPATATAMPPTATPAPPTATPVPPAATPAPPTATPVPPAATPLPPIATPTPVVVTKEVPTTLTDLAKAIEAGEIDVGEEYGLAFGQRYHNIHAVVLGLQCTTCHIGAPDTAQTVFAAQDVAAQAPGPVERSACLGCHGAGSEHQLFNLGSP